MLRHRKITNHEIKILRPRYTQVMTIISDRLRSKNIDVTLHIPIFFHFSIKEIKNKGRKPFHETIFKIESLGSSDSVFPLDSKYGFSKSYYALEPFIWQKRIWVKLHNFVSVKSKKFVSCRFSLNFSFCSVYTLK